MNEQAKSQSLEFDPDDMLQREMESKIGTDSGRLYNRIRNLVHFSARWHGSYTFGLAHGSVVQKVIGTTLSSLLVESRLVARRGTLWGAMAAHITFNMVTLFCRRNLIAVILLSRSLEWALEKLEQSLPQTLNGAGI